jgi:bacteriocin-like protein
MKQIKENEGKVEKTEMVELTKEQLRNISGGLHWEWKIIDGKQIYVLVI